MDRAEFLAQPKNESWSYSHERNNHPSREFRNPLENAGGSEVTTCFTTLRFPESSNPAEAPQ